MAKRHFDGPYAGYNGRRRLEHEDYNMIHEDHSAMSNLPQNVIMKAYPKEHGFTPEVLNDTIRGVDGQIGADNGKKMKHFKPHKY